MFERYRRAMLIFGGASVFFYIQMWLEWIPWCPFWFFLGYKAHAYYLVSTAVLVALPFIYAAKMRRGLAKQEPSRAEVLALQFLYSARVARGLARRDARVLGVVLIIFVLIFAPIPCLFSLASPCVTERGSTGVYYVVHDYGFFGPGTSYAERKWIFFIKPMPGRPE